MTTHTLAFIIAATLGIGACKAKPEDKPADNTAQNQRDKSAVPTADQSGQSKSDVDVTAGVRKAVVGDSSLSTNAHNCKIVVNSGVVTLTGPVASTDEKTKIEGLATGVAGVTKVINQLEVAN
jgi:hyperosmotically inducible protein